MRDQKTEKIIGAAIGVHKHLGPGLLENIYEEALCHEFDLQGILYKRQKEIDVCYKHKIIRGQRLDLLVRNEIIVEVKSLIKLPEIAIAQTISYLKATGLKLGLIINFGERTLVKGIKRISL